MSGQSVGERLAAIDSRENVLCCLPKGDDLRGGWSVSEVFEENRLQIAAMCAASLFKGKGHDCQDVVVICSNTIKDVIRVMCFDGVSAQPDPHSMALALADRLSGLNDNGELVDVAETIGAVVEELRGKACTACTVCVLDLEFSREGQLIVSPFTVGDAPFFVINDQGKRLFKNRERSDIYDAVLSSLQKTLGRCDKNELKRRLNLSRLGEWSDFLDESVNFEDGEDKELFFQLLAWEIVRTKAFEWFFSLTGGSEFKYLNMPQQVLNYDSRTGAFVCDALKGAEKEDDGIKVVRGTYDSFVLCEGDVLVMGSDAVSDLGFLGWLKAVKDSSEAKSLVKLFKNLQLSGWVHRWGRYFGSSGDDTSCVVIKCV